MYILTNAYTEVDKEWDMHMWFLSLFEFFYSCLLKDKDCVYPHT